MTESGKFIGPLTEESLKKAAEKFDGLYYGSDIAREIAREKAGRELAQVLLKQTQDKLETSKIDQMTGLLRRDAFLEAVGEALPTLRYNNPRRIEDRDAALFMMLDIVDLHGINNSGGQAAGDKAIKATADFIRFISRVSDESASHGPDIAGRLGGDEFAVFFPYHHNKVKHEQMIEIIENRISMNRQIDSETSNPDSPPGIRYDFYSIWLGQRLPSIEDLLKRTDPKRPDAEPRFTYPINDAQQLFK